MNSTIYESVLYSVIGKIIRDEPLSNTSRLEKSHLAHLHEKGNVAVDKSRKCGYRTVADSKKKAPAETQTLEKDGK